MSELVICLSSPLSRVLVKHVISARAREGCACRRIHERMWACVSACTRVQYLTRRGLLLLLCRDTWQHMTEQLEQSNWSAQAANSNHISNYTPNPYFYKPTNFQCESNLQIQNKFITFNIIYCDNPQKERTESLSFLYSDSTCVSMSYVQHNNSAPWRAHLTLRCSCLAALLNPAIPSTCNFSNSLFFQEAVTANPECQDPFYM